MGVTIIRAVTLPNADARIKVGRFGGLHVLELKPVYFTRRQERIKRAFDVVVSGLCLIFLCPLILVVALSIKLTSRGPVLYRSKRVGRHFTFLKFRSMYDNRERRAQLATLNEKCGHLFKIRNDRCVTPLGRFLRRYSLDEPPQLLNVTYDQPWEKWNVASAPR